MQKYTNEINIAAMKIIPGLDGLRGISIIFVIIFHSFMLNKTGHNNILVETICNLMDMGVDCFFVISGFLITRILLKNKSKKNYYRNFITKRALRIIPLYYLLLFVAFIIIPNLSHPYLSKWKEISNPEYYWLFLSNFYIIKNGGFNNGLLDISWSLALEEQFYLFWPWIIYFLSTKSTKFFCFLMLSLGIILRYFFFYYEKNPIKAHLFPLAHMDALLVGSLLSLYISESQGILKSNIIKIVSILGNLGFIYYFILILVRILNITSAPTGLFNYTFASFIFLKLLMLGLTSGTKTYKVLNQPLLSSIGKYSYAIYLFHNPISSLTKYLANLYTPFAALNLLSAYITQFIIVFLTIAISYFIAIVSYHLFEKHFLKLKETFN